MDISSMSNIAALAAAQPSSPDPELSPVSRIENSARTRAYSPGRKQVPGRQDSDLTGPIDDVETEPYSQEGSARSQGKISFFA
jgi:hypothetical protein